MIYKSNWNSSRFTSRLGVGGLCCTQMLIFKVFVLFNLRTASCCGPAPRWVLFRINGPTSSAASSDKASVWIQFWWVCLELASSWQRVLVPHKLRICCSFLPPSAQWTTRPPAPLGPIPVPGLPSGPLQKLNLLRNENCNQELRRKLNYEKGRNINCHIIIIAWI